MRQVTFALTMLIAATAAANDTDPAALVRQLGDKRFAARDAAEKRLVVLAAKAKPALRTGVSDADAEVAQRCKAILQRIRDEERTAWLAGKADWPGPVGKKFRDIVGDSEAARKLFAEVLRVPECCDTLDRLDDAPATAPAAYASELARIEKAWESVMAQFQGMPIGPDQTAAMCKEARKVLQPGEVILALLLHSFQTPEDAGKPARLWELLSTPFMDLARGPLKQPFVKLFFAWLDRQSDATNLTRGLEAAMYAPIPEACPTASRVLQDKKAAESTLKTAMLLLGHHGATEDLVRLAAYRDDARIIWKYQGGTSELRDLAVAMSLMVQRQDPKSFGFTMGNVVAWYADPVTYRDTWPFPTADARDAAHKKAWAWLDEQAKNPKK